MLFVRVAVKKTNLVTEIILKRPWKKFFALEYRYLRFLFRSFQIAELLIFVKKNDESHRSRT